MGTARVTKILAILETVTWEPLVELTRNDPNLLIVINVRKYFKTATITGPTGLLYLTEDLAGASRVEL